VRRGGRAAQILCDLADEVEAEARQFARFARGAGERVEGGERLGVGADLKGAQGVLNLDG
jgi:hypothetical protein